MNGANTVGLLNTSGEAVLGSNKMDPQLYCLRWNNHQTNLLSVFDQLLQVEAFCDVTLAVDGASIKCHKMVLAACSTYFQSLFMENTCKHPIVFLKDIRFHQIRALLDYMYHGEVSIEEAELQALLKIAEALRVKGLVESDEEKAKASPTKSKVSTASSSSQRSHSSLSSAPIVKSIWPVQTSKLLSPTAKGGPREPTEEDPGHLVIDEENPETQAPTTMSPLDVDYDMAYLNDDTPPAPGMVKTIGPNGKVEWKRYKQYTKDDILAAIEEVKGGMSALQASRKYGVPSRTLYDKVKKMGILTANMQKQLQQKKASEVEAKAVSNSNSNSNSNSGTNNYPPINLLGLQLPQASLPQQDKDGKNSVPPLSGANMMFLMERMKLVAGAGGIKPIPPSSSPLNLSAMLDHNTAGSEDDTQKSSESNRSSDDPDIKNELDADSGDIRAQFFAQLANTANHRIDINNGTDQTTTTSVSASVIRPVNGDSRIDSKAVTLAPRSDLSHPPSPASPTSPACLLPHRKRKYSHEPESEAGCKRGNGAVEEEVAMNTASC